MKYSLLMTAFIFSISFANAGDNCTAEIGNFLSDLAPKTGIVKVTGKYTKKSESGEFKDCSLSIKLNGNQLVPNFTPESFNPSYGDGGAFWPFGMYPTVEIETNEYSRLRYYECAAGEKGFGIDYIYKSRSGWRKSSRYSLELEKNSDGTYSASLRAGSGYIHDKLVTCKGTISEVNN